MSSLIKRVRNRPPIKVQIETRPVLWDKQYWDVPVGVSDNTYRQRRISKWSHEEACDLNRKPRRSPNQGSVGLKLEQHPLRVWEPKKFSGKVSDDQKEIMK